MEEKKYGLGDLVGVEPKHVETLKMHLQGIKEAEVAFKTASAHLTKAGEDMWGYVYDICPELSEFVLSYSSESEQIRIIGHKDV